MIGKKLPTYILMTAIGAAAAAGPIGCGDSGADRESYVRRGQAAGEEAAGPGGGGELTGEHGEDEWAAGHDDHGRGDSASSGGAGLEEPGIEISEAGPASIGRAIDLPGEIKLNGDLVVHVVPRFEGIVREVRTGLGDDVRRGEIMAVVESRELADATAEYLASRGRLALARETYEREEKLWRKKISSEQEYLDAKQAFTEAHIANRAAEQKLLNIGFSKKALEKIPAHGEADLTRCEIPAPIDGTVIEKRLSLGGAVTENTEMFVVADLGSVWVDISVYQEDLAFVREGQEASITVGTGAPPVKGTIDYVGPVLGRDTRTALARLTLKNPGGDLRPGTFVTVKVSTESVRVPVAVPRSALQTLEDGTIVFVPEGGGFEPRPVATGRSSEAFIEIVSGLEPGERYVSRGAFNLKAQLVTGSLDGHAGHGH